MNNTELPEDASDPYAGTGGTSAGNPVTDKSTNPGFWDIVTHPLDSFGTVEEKVEKRVTAIAGFAAQEHDRTNESLKYVTYIVGIVGAVYLATLVAPALMNGATWVPRKK